jgi:PAS domain S-box-containing protein
MDNHPKTSAEFEKLLEELRIENALLRTKLESQILSESDRESNRQQPNFEKFFNLSLDLLCIADTDGYFIKVNEAWGKVLGYSIQDLESKKFTDFIHPDDLESTYRAMNDLSMQKQVIDFVNRYRASDGSWCYIEWYSQPVGKYIYAAARDISEHINAKKALQSSEERFSLVIDASELGIWDWNIITNEVFYSPQWK